MLSVTLNQNSVLFTKSEGSPLIFSEKFQVLYGKARAAECQFSDL
jgi:hypothetical protein